MNRPFVPRPPGGANSAAKQSPIGSAAAYMNGCRRPQREWKLSEIEPTRGSVSASTQSARKIARPESVPGSPSTAV